MPGDRLFSITMLSTTPCSGYCPTSSSLHEPAAGCTACAPAGCARLLVAALALLLLLPSSSLCRHSHHVRAIKCCSQKLRHGARAPVPQT